MPSLVISVGSRNFFDQNRQNTTAPARQLIDRIASRVISQVIGIFSPRKKGRFAVFSAQTRYAEAKTELMTAITLLDADDARAELARTYNDLGTTEYFLGDFASAHVHYSKALTAFEALGDPGEQANAYRNLQFVTEDVATKLELLE